MEKDFLIKVFSKNRLLEEFDAIGFDNVYKRTAIEKYDGSLYKIFDLTVVQATILKQTALSCGTDCAIHRDVLINKVEFTDAILFATKTQLKLIIEKLKHQPFKLRKLAEDLEKKFLLEKSEIRIKNSVFNINNCYLMGILNITPDSFSDGNKYLKKEDAINRFNELVEQNTEIIDIGAESTRPNSIRISPEEEIERLKPLLENINAKEQVISIDTMNAKTAEFALQKGINIVNDVTGLSNDKNMAEIVKKYNAFIVLTENTRLETTNTVDEIIKNLIKKIEFAKSFGIEEEKIILDVGLGFNKTVKQNFELIKCAKDICSLGFFTLYGLSRKSFIQKITEKTVLETEFANTSLAIYLALQGVNFIRVHDVKAHKIAFQALNGMLNNDKL